MSLTDETEAQFRALGLTPEEVAEIAVSRPSLRGMLMGYAAEYKARKLWFSDPRISDLVVPDDHDRTQKFDMRFEYGGRSSVSSASRSRVTQFERRRPDSLGGYSVAAATSAKSRCPTAR